MAQLANTTLINDANLVSYYKLENTSDSKGSNTLTNHNTVSFSAAKYNNGADLGSGNTNKYLNSGNNLGLAGNGAMSIVGWVKIYNSSHDEIFFIHESTTTSNRNIAIKQDGSGNFGFLGGGTSASTAFSDTTLFHHIAITRDGSGNHLGYIDGVQKASFNATGTANAINDFQIGNYTVTSEFAQAIFDDVAIFSRVLTPTEILTLATDTTGGSFLFNLI